MFGNDLILIFLYYNYVDLLTTMNDELPANKFVVAVNVLAAYTQQVLYQTANLRSSIQ